MESTEGFKSWAIVEVMGHSVYCGYATDASIGGQSFLRVDVPAFGNQPAFTKYLGTGSIFSITPTDEETARAMGERRNTPPMDTYSIRDIARSMAEKMVAKQALPAPETSRVNTQYDIDETFDDDDEDY